MTVRVLVINAEAQAKADAIVAHAMDRPYRPGPNTPSPADDPNLVARFGDYKTVFTFTHLGDEIVRHLTISVPAEGKYPNPVAAAELAKLFGFKEEEGDILMGPHETEPCAVIVQRVKR
jgi:hypothetical protein